MIRLLAFVATAAALGIWLVLRSLALPDGPVPVIWDKSPCAECRMHVGDPAFAAQLQTAAGEVLDFDDPGCLIRYRERAQPAVHAVWFHDVREDRWHRESEAAFVQAEPSPMGFGYGAVAAGTPGASSLAEVRAAILAREAGR